MGVQKISKGRVLVGALDQNQGPRTLRVPLAATANTSPVASGVKVPPNSRILDAVVVLNSTSSSATPLLDVGVTASQAFLLTGVSTASAGVVQGSLVAGAVTVGTGLLEGAAASGGFTRKPFVTPVSGDTEIVYATRQAAARLEGTIVVTFEKL